MLGEQLRRPRAGIAGPGRGADRFRHHAGECIAVTADLERDRDIVPATFGYLGAIFLGPVIPLAVYVLRSRRSAFMRYHAATQGDLSLTAELYGLCCPILGGPLLLASTTVALIVVLPVGLLIWASALRYLIRGA